MLGHAHYAHTRYESCKINVILKKIQLHYIKPKLYFLKWNILSSIRKKMVCKLSELFGPSFQSMQPGQNQLNPQRFEDSQNYTPRTSPKKQSGRKHNPVVFPKIDWHLQILWISGNKRPLKNSNAAIPEHICSLTTGMHESSLWAVKFSSAVLQSQNASPTFFPLVWQVSPHPRVPSDTDPSHSNRDVSCSALPFAWGTVSMLILTLEALHWFRPPWS